MSDECSDAKSQVTNTTERSFGERMLDADFPHDVQNIELLETHISWVVLTGKLAYKLKKPIRLDFLDYSTIDLRKKYCDRELQINRVWADDIYKDVVPVFKRANKLRVGTADEPCRDDEEIVDYAVLMNQFPQSALLAEQLKAGNISPEMIETLGAEIANLHMRIEPVPYRADLVRGGAIDPAIENCDYLINELSEADPDFSRSTAIKQWTIETADRMQPFMERRARKGSVKECHGDLHLGNILYLDGKFVPFDGVEFNESFSQVEGLDEIAFLAMELSEHGFQPHARRLLNRYLETTGDYESLLLLRYFLVYRAMVRAKVDMIRQVQRFECEPSTSRPSHPRLSADGRKYLDYAKRLLSETSPELWITYGLSGSGKSTASTKVIETRGYFRVRSDVQRKLIACRDPYEKTVAAELPKLYSSEMTDLTYQRLWTIADQILQSGFGVIVDAAFLRAELRQPFRELANQHHVPYHILVCEAPTEELKVRLDQRGIDPSDADASVLQSQLRIAEPPSGDEKDFIVRSSEIV